MPQSCQINKLRAGVIGTGFIGPVHVEALRRLGVNVVALCDLPETVGAQAERLGIPQTFGDFRKLIECPDVDVVHIAAPNRFHSEMALAVIAAGKHCVCEKPLAMTTAETSAIVQAARSKDKIFAVNYNIRFYPAVLQLRQSVASGELGEIVHVNGSYMQDWLFKETDYNWRLLPEEGGKLRAVADIGTHWMDAVSFILGQKIQSVFALLSTHHKVRRRPLGEVKTFSRANGPMEYVSYPVKTEDFANLLLRFADGPMGNLAVSQVAAGRKNSIRIEIYGTRKSAWWCSEEPEKLYFGNRDSANEVVIRSSLAFGSGASGFMDYPAGHVEGFPDTFKMSFRSVYSEAAGCPIPGGPLYANVLDGHQEVAVCEAVLASHQSGSWVDVQ